MSFPAFPRFQPHPLVRGGHAQTLAGHFFPGNLAPYRARQHAVALPDGDTVILHDDRPKEWKPSDRTVLLIHGLAGSHESPYVRRIAAKLNDRGIRAFRMDLRGCGAGEGLAKFPYHSGRTEDATTALEMIARLCPDSPAALVGFSLGGNITLKLLGEVKNKPPGNLDRAMAVCPPIDLSACTVALSQNLNRIYDRYFVRLLSRQLEDRRRRIPDAAYRKFDRRPRRLMEFDDQFTAPICGFGTAANYYRTCSSGRFLQDIELPCLILAARDDPMIPPISLESADVSATTVVHLTDTGGHLGFVAKNGIDPDRRWMDWRVVDFAAAPEPPRPKNDP
ncbi:MAG: alpha/beta fold hydrolase [Planctomycetota bacterium]